MSEEDTPSSTHASTSDVKWVLTFVYASTTYPNSKNETYRYVYKRHLGEYTSYETARELRDHYISDDFYTLSLTYEEERLKSIRELPKEYSPLLESNGVQKRTMGVELRQMDDESMSDEEDYPFSDSDDDSDDQ